MVGDTPDFNRDGLHDALARRQLQAAVTRLSTALLNCAGAARRNSVREAIIGVTRVSRGDEAARMGGVRQ